MTKLLIIPAIFITAVFMPNLCRALPAPCTQEELLSTSDFAVEGRIVKFECGEPYESNECTAKDGGNFVPELLAKCSAEVLVTENIKGKYKKGDKAVIQYLQLVQQCENGNHIIPGSPVKDFSPNSVIKYYNSEKCKYWNYVRISVPPSNASEAGPDVVY